MAHTVFSQEPLRALTDNSRFGNVFAFLVQACLTSTMSTAYIQWVWRRCRQQAVSIGAMDAAFTADRDMLVLLKPGFISAFPAAAALALAVWYVALSTLQIYASERVYAGAFH